MKQRLRSLTARGMNGYKLYSRNWPNSRALADEFCRSNRGKKSTAPGCISSRRLRSAFGIVLKTRQSTVAFREFSRNSGRKVREISEAIHVSKPYAALIRAGRSRPHPRHWETLAGIVSVSGDA